MTLQVLILLILASLVKAQEVIEPDMAFNERFMNVGVNTVHSVKGKLYEEKQRKIISKPDNNKESVNILKAEKIAEAQQMNPELTRQRENIFFRQNRDNESKHSLSDMRKTMLDIKNDAPKELQETQGNNSDSNLLGKVRRINDLSQKESFNTRFDNEHLISSYDKNSTIETIKKELSFDSLFIKNNFNNNNILQAPTNVIDSYMNQENYPVADIMDKPVVPWVDESNRRIGTNTYYEPVPSDPFQIPIRDDKNILRLHTPKFETTEYDNLQNNINSGNGVPLRQDNYNVIDKHTCEGKDSDEALDRMGNDIKLQDPTKGFGITNVGKSSVMLMDHPRVCYACSSINDLSCWTPNRQTAVKYCRTDHLSCLAKLYKYKGLSYIIRDCGNTCELNALAGGPTKYTSCTICHHDLCNSAYNFKIQNVTILLFLIFHLLRFC